MRIVFNLHNVGLGNNGGSRTIIKCAEVLSSSGADVLIYSPKNTYTWHKPAVSIVGSKPKCDIMIATGFRSVHDTVKSKVKKKFYYIRGFEQWVTSPGNLVESYRKLQCIVNSEWLFNFLKRRNIQSSLIYPGLDFDLFYGPHNTTGCLGGLYHTKHITKRHGDVIKIAKMLNKDVLLLNKDITNADPVSLRKFYRKISVWISPSELEGLHNCPMEASLCGANVVSTDHGRSGTTDYMIHKKTGLIYESRNLTQACEQVHRILSDTNYANILHSNMVELLKEKIGTRQQNMQKMLNLFKE